MVKHISPTFDPANGVALYGRLVDEIVAGLPSDSVTSQITHIELGYSGWRELWQAYRLRTRDRDHKLVLTLHDPPVVVGKPFSRWLGGSGLPSRVIRKALDVIIGRAIIGVTVRSADAVIVLNPLAKLVVARQFKLKSDRVFISALPDLLGLPAAPRRPATLTPKLLFFGNLAQHKGLHTLIEAYAEAGLDQTATPLVIAGGWGDNAAYRKTIEQLVPDTSTISLIGRVDDAQLRQEIGSASVIILPYTDPGIIHASGPLIASMAAGKAIIASDIPVFSGYITDRQNGLLFPQGDAQALSAALTKLLTDPALQRRLGQNAQRYVQEHCTLAAIAKQLTTIYASL